MFIFYSLLTLFIPNLTYARVGIPSRGHWVAIYGGDNRARHEANVSVSKSRCFHPLKDFSEIGA